MFFFAFPGDLKAHAATKEMIAKVKTIDFSEPALLLNR